MNPLPPGVRYLAYAGLIPFIGLAFMDQLAPTPINYLSAESIASYGAIIVAFMGALHWGANLQTLGKPHSGDRWIDRNAWIWGITPALIAWVALHIYIPVSLIILAATLVIQRNIDKDTYTYYFTNDEARSAFLTMRTRLSYIAAACLTWAALVILFIQN